MKKIDQTTAGLREMLFEELELLRAGKINSQRADKVSKLSAQVLTSVRLELEYQRYVHDITSKKIGSYKTPILELGV